MDLRTEYAALVKYEGTRSFVDAGREGRSCMTSAIYAHYCNRSELKPYMVSFGLGSGECDRYLDLAHNVTNGSSVWVCSYIGEVAISSKGRIAAKRFRHEFELCGYFQQAPALEALCAVMFEARGWIPWSQRANSGKLRTYLTSTDKGAFLRWCEMHVRCAWVPVDIHLNIAKRKVTDDELGLIRELKPLLNVKKSLNPFAPIVTEARRRFRSRSV